MTLAVIGAVLLSGCGQFEAVDSSCSSPWFQQATQEFGALNPSQDMAISDVYCYRTKGGEFAIDGIDAGSWEATRRAALRAGWVPSPQSDCITRAIESVKTYAYHSVDQAIIVQTGSEGRLDCEDE